ncbi:hypothetical protein ANN_24234 [Periplaneta americana]|uniref:RNase H type-1 domain-containing protein n=1 Tax=Periplaneta americana TaxID=6978 RepID=A0ABQ8S2I6_PERAM|nr:hypothetical protein ANN_24234 [Periplaneta americana]
MAGLCEGGNEPLGFLKARPSRGTGQPRPRCVNRGPRTRWYREGVEESSGDAPTALKKRADKKIHVISCKIGYLCPLGLNNSRITLDSLRNQANHTHLIEEIRREVKEAERNKWKIEFNWIKAHAGHEGNELADQLAKEAARSEDIQESYCKTPKSAKIRILKWFGHLMRMSEDRWPKQIYQWKPPGRRGRGRPKRTWDNEVMEVMHKRGLRNEDAQDRSLWRIGTGRR